MCLFKDSDDGTHRFSVALAWLPDILVVERRLAQDQRLSFGAIGFAVVHFVDGSPEGNDFDGKWEGLDRGEGVADAEKFVVDRRLVRDERLTYGAIGLACRSFPAPGPTTWELARSLGSVTARIGRR